MQKELGRIVEVGDVVTVEGLRLEVRSIDGRGRNTGELAVRRVAAPAEGAGAEGAA